MAETGCGGRNHVPQRDEIAESVLAPFLKNRYNVCTGSFFIEQSHRRTITYEIYAYIRSAFGKARQ